MTINVLVKGMNDVQWFTQNSPQRVFDSVSDAIKREALAVQVAIQRKLDGDVLRTQSGRLRRSITTSFDGEGTANMRARIGTNVIYARAQEFGFQGSVSVKAHQRMQKIAFGRPMKDPRMVNVAQHSMRMNIKAHPFVAPSMEQSRDRIKTNLKKAVMQAMRGTR